MRPDVSVVILVRSGHRFIRDAVNSALSQTGVNLEVLIIDDCSDEKTVDMIKQITKTDDRLIYIRTPSVEGPSGARNIGVNAANGDWVAFLDANDKWHNEKLLRQFDLIKRYELSGKYPPLCYTGVYVLKGDGRYTGRILKAPLRVTARELLQGNVIIASSVMVRRNYLLENPFESCDVHGDYVEWFRILNKYGPGVGISRPLVRYRLADKIKPRNKIKSARMAWRTYKFLGLTTLQALVSFAYYIKFGLQRYVL